MKNIEKKKTEPFREFIYCRVANTASYPLVYVAIVSLNLLIDFSLLSLAVRFRICRRDPPTSHP